MGFRLTTRLSALFRVSSGIVSGIVKDHIFYEILQYHFHGMASNRCGIGFGSGFRFPECKPAFCVSLAWTHASCPSCPRLRAERRCSSLGLAPEGCVHRSGCGFAGSGWYLETLCSSFLVLTQGLYFSTQKGATYTILYYTILYYTILYYTILYYTILYYTILYYTILYYTILYYTISYYALPYYTIPYYNNIILYLRDHSLQVESGRDLV